MFTFDTIWYKAEKLLHSVYVLSNSSYQPQSGFPFVYFAYVSPGPVGYKLQKDKPLALNEAITGTFSFSKLGHFALFFTINPLDELEAEKLEESLVALCLGKHLIHDLFTHTGYIIWPTDVLNMDLNSDVFLQLTGDKKTSNWQLSSSPSTILAGKINSLALNSQGVDDILLSYNDAGDLQIGSEGYYPYLYYVSGANSSWVAQGMQITLPFGSSPDAITLQCSGNLSPYFFNLPIGFAFALVPTDSIAISEGLTPSNLFYPLWPSGMNGQTNDSVSFNLNPIMGTGTLSHQPWGYSPPYGSNFKDIYGRTITLATTGQTDDYLLYTTIDSSFYFAPNTTFIPSYEGLADKNAITLVCGLSGNEYFNIPYGGKLAFQGGQAALVKMIAPAVGSSVPTFQQYPETGTCPYLTSMAVLIPPAVTNPIEYCVQSQKAPLFDATDASSQVWNILEIGGISLPENTQPFAMLPYQGVSAMATGLGSTTAGITSFESAFIAPMRNAQMLIQGQVVFNQGITAVTPQGIYVQTPTASTISISVGPEISSSVFSITGSSDGWAAQLFEAITTPQTFLVISSLPKGQVPGNDVTAIISMDGWAFDIKLPATTPATFGEPIIILKAGGASLAQMVSTPDNWSYPATFNVNDFDPKHSQLSAYLSSVINDARTLYNEGEGVQAYGDLVTLADNPQWNGFIILNAVIDVKNCSPDIAPLFIGIDPVAPVCAAYLGITSAKMGSTGSGCSFFGLVDYLRPGATLQDAQSGNPGYIPITNTYDFRLVYLRALFRNASLISFDSAALLILGSLFDEKVTQYSLDGDQAGGTNSIFIEGSAQTGPDGSTHYIFSAPTGCYGTFYLASSAVDALIISDVRAQVNTSASPPTFTFTFSGWMDMRNNPTMDLLSYEAIRFRDLSLCLSYDINVYPPQLSFSSCQAPILLTPGEALLSETNSPPSTKVNLYRANSLVGQMPLQFVQLIKGRETGKSPSDLGYLKINPPAGLSTPDLELNWYGLLLSLALGNNGLTAGKGLISAEILLCWVPGGNSDNSISIAPYFALASADGQALELEIEGVIKLGAKSVAMTATAMQDADSDTYSQFTLQLQGIGLTVLSTTLPAGGGLSVYLGGYGDANGNRALGWFGGLGQYAEVPLT